MPEIDRAGEDEEEVISWSDFSVRMPTSDGWGDLNWTVRYPPGFEKNTDESWPVLLWLQSRHGLTTVAEDVYVPYRWQQKYIVAFPTCEDRLLPKHGEPHTNPLVTIEDAHDLQSWRMRYSEEALFRIIEETVFRTKNEYGSQKVDHERIHLMGYSMGSTACFNVAATFGRYLGCVVGFSSPGDSDVYDFHYLF